MLNRLKLYFTPYPIPDTYYIAVLRAHGLNPDREYDKTKHRIPMLESVIDVLSDLGRKSGVSVDFEMESYTNTLNQLRRKKNEKSGKA